MPACSRHGEPEWSSVVRGYYLSVLWHDVSDYTAPNCFFIGFLYITILQAVPNHPYIHLILLLSKRFPPVEYMLLCQSESRRCYIMEAPASSCPTTGTWAGRNRRRRMMGCPLSCLCTGRGEGMTRDALWWRPCSLSCPYVGTGRGNEFCWFSFCAAVLWSWPFQYKKISKQKICEQDSHAGWKLKQENTEDLKATYADLMEKEKRAYDPESSQSTYSLIFMI